MKLQDYLANANEIGKLGFEAIAKDQELATQIQILLIGLELLEPPADGKFGPVSGEALEKFQELTKTGETGYLGAVTAEKLIETKLTDLPKPPLKLGDDIASRIVKYMLDNVKVSLKLLPFRWKITVVISAPLRPCAPATSTVIIGRNRSN